MELTQGEITRILRQKHRQGGAQATQTAEQRRASKAKWEREKYASDPAYRERAKARAAKSARRLNALPF